MFKKYEVICLKVKSHSKRYEVIVKSIVMIFKKYKVICLKSIKSYV